MDMELKDKKNEVPRKSSRHDFSFKSLFSVVKNSYNGLKYFFKYERSSLVYLTAAAFSVGARVILQMDMMEWIVIFFVLFSMLASELLNTAIEAVCDLVSPEYNPYVKIAKDTASAATGVLSILWSFVILVIYVPKVIEVIEKMF